MEQEETGDFYVLPVGCISTILSLTSPRDVCRLSAVSSIFRSAAESDVVWEKLLPSDYQEIISRSASSSPLVFSSKRDLYFRLCHRPILIDDGSKSFSLDKWSGKKCYMVAARELSIVWGKTLGYRRWRSLPDSRFSEVAELLLVSWLEINGKIDAQLLSPKTNYAVYFVFKFSDANYGCDIRPMVVSVILDGGRGGVKSTVYLDPNSMLRRQHQVCEERYNLISHIAIRGECMKKEIPRERGDGWLELELGEFLNEEGAEFLNEEGAGEIDMSLMDVRRGYQESGIIIQGIELKPIEKNK